MAIRLQPVLSATNSSVVESDLRSNLKQRYGKHYRGLQYFLNPSSASSQPIRTRNENNTKSCKCVFIAHEHIDSEVLERLLSGNLYLAT